MSKYIKHIPKVVLLVAILAAFAFAGSINAEGRGAKVEMSTSLSGGVVTYSITVVNDSTNAIGDMYVAGKIPEGATFQSASATPGQSWFRGVEGTSAVWLANGVPAKSKIGPFSYSVKTANGKINPSAAYVHYRLPSDTILTSTDVEESGLTLAKLKGLQTADKIIFPDSKAAISLSAGYAQKDNEKMIASGLSKVPLGTFVNLNSRNIGEGEKDLKAWSWTLETPSGSTAQLESADTQTPRFYADRAGKYVATLTATDVDGKRASSSVEITAARYVGGDWCASCHNGSVMPDVVSQWQETGHATKFVDTYARYSATSDYCVRCHTVGYDETDKAGGFDDAVQLAGYDLSKGSFLKQAKEANKTVDQVMADPNIARFANIQCENCHGPGGTSHTGAKSYETGVCNQCHSQNKQWENSKHAIEPPLHMAEGSSCVECHTSQGFVAVKMRGEKAVFPNNAAGEKPTIPDPGAMSAIGCVTCHDPHQATYPIKNADGTTKSLQLRVQGEVTMPNGVTVDAEVSAACVSCHANKRDVAYKAAFLAGKNTRGVHDNSQADVFYGAGAVEYGKSYGSSAHKSVVTEGCAECHMAATPGGKTDASAPGNNKVGGHTFAVEAGGVENVANACGSCHSGLTTFNRPARGDYDGDSKVEGVQDEVKGLLALVESKLPKDAKGAVVSSINTSNTTEADRKALWNYSLIKNDGSNGVHNTRFAVEVLQETYFQLAGSKVPNAATP